MTVFYLTLDEVVAIHARLIEQFGGDSGLRDRAMLESALGMPRASFDGLDLHATLEEKAAAYLYHLVAGHAFVDGNKRIGLAAAIAFLGMNGASVETTNEALTELVLGVATGMKSRSAVAVFFTETLRLEEDGK